MDVQRAFRTCRMWNQQGSISAMGVLWDRGGVINEDHREQLLQEIGGEMEYCQRAIATHDKDRSGNEYTKVDYEDLLALQTVAEEAVAGDELMPPYNQIKEDELAAIVASWGIIREGKVPIPSEIFKIKNKQLKAQLEAQLEEQVGDVCDCDDCVADREKKQKAEKMKESFDEIVEKMMEEEDS